MLYIQNCIPINSTELIDLNQCNLSSKLIESIQLLFQVSCLWLSQFVFLKQMTESIDVESSGGPSIEADKAVPHLQSAKIHIVLYYFSIAYCILLTSSTFLILFIWEASFCCIFLHFSTFHITALFTPLSVPHPRLGLGTATGWETGMIESIELIQNIPKKVNEIERFPKKIQRNGTFPQKRSTKWNVFQKKATK